MRPLFTLIVCAVILVLAMRVEPPDEFDIELSAEQEATIQRLRREQKEWTGRVAMCRDLVSPQSVPEELEDGTVVCVTPRGDTVLPKPRGML